MNKLGILVSLLLLSGCQSLEYAVPEGGRTATVRLADTWPEPIFMYVNDCTGSYYVRGRALVVEADKEVAFRLDHYLKTTGGGVVRCNLTICFRPKAEQTYFVNVPMLQEPKDGACTWSVSKRQVINGRETYLPESSARLTGGPVYVAGGRKKCE